MKQFIINSVAFSFLGIIILIIAFALVEWLTPKHSLRKEILEKQTIRDHVVPRIPFPVKKKGMPAPCNHRPPATFHTCIRSPHPGC